MKRLSREDLIHVVIGTAVLAVVFTTVICAVHAIASRVLK